eukprot:scaffold49338_cov39-Cyclotella_meneghiniana.AAC.2
MAWPNEAKRRHNPPTGSMAWVDLRPQHECNSNVKGLITCELTVAALSRCGYDLPCNDDCNVVNVVVKAKRSSIELIEWKL